MFLDPQTVLFDGKPVAEMLEVLSRGGVKDRRAAATDLLYVYWGLPCVMMESGRPGWTIAESKYCRQRAELMLPHLIAALGDTDAGVRLAVVKTIRWMYAHAASARSALQSMMSDSDAQVRKVASEALDLIPE